MRFTIPVAGALTTMMPASEVFSVDDRQDVAISDARRKNKRAAILLTPFLESVIGIILLPSIKTLRKIAVPVCGSAARCAAGVKPNASLLLANLDVPNSSS